MELISERWSASEELQLELDRSRRFGHHFALVRISCRRGLADTWSFVHELATALNALLRRVDRVWADGTSVYLLLPECDRTMVESMLGRIREPLSRLLAETTSAEVSAAVFPDDGMTSGALFDALDGNSATDHSRRVPGAVPQSPETPAA